LASGFFARFSRSSHRIGPRTGGSSSEANASWNKHFNNGDAHALAALYDEKAVQGREEIEKLLKTPGGFLAQSAAIRLPTVKRRKLFK
jgi:hypothetical protein